LRPGSDLAFCLFGALPIRAHLVDDPSEGEWSSYQATAGISKSPSWLMTDRVLDEFGLQFQGPVSSRDSLLNSLDEILRIG